MALREIEIEIGAGRAFVERTDSGMGLEFRGVGGVWFGVPLTPAEARRIGEALLTSAGEPKSAESHSHGE